MRSAKKSEKKQNANIEKKFGTRVGIINEMFGAEKIVGRRDANIVMNDAMQGAIIEKIPVAG